MKIHTITLTFAGLFGSEVSRQMTGSFPLPEYQQSQKDIELARKHRLKKYDKYDKYANI